MPVAESAPILQNLMKVDGLMLASTPPVSTASKSPSSSPATAAPMAAIAEAQAASQTKLGPWKSNRLATRPAMMFESSPGIVSSQISGKLAPTPERNSRSMAPRTASGSARKLGARVSSRAYSGSIRRVAVR